MFTVRGLLLVAAVILLVLAAFRVGGRVNLALLAGACIVAAYAYPMWKG